MLAWHRPGFKRTAGGISLAGALVLAAAPETGLDALPGPVPARVVAVVDGDTITVRAQVWLGQEVQVSVRLLGIDAPELRGRCPRESALAAEAKKLIEREIGDGAIRLRDIRHDKYGGRVLARVETRAGRDLAETLTRSGLARRYDGRARRPWCEA